MLGVSFAIAVTAAAMAVSSLQDGLAVVLAPALPRPKPRG
jgi:hypothetical protein